MGRSGLRWPPGLVPPLLNAAITALIVVPGVTAAMVHKEYGIRQVEKVFITTHMNLLGRTETSTCPTSYSLCASSVGGGCCPSDYECDTDSCVRTTAPVMSACGKLNWFACGIDVGGGCCPSGYICGDNACTAPAGVSYSQQCPTDYYLCPASYNYGCCKNGMGCGPNVCYATTPSTVIFTATFTTTTDSTGSGAVTTITSTTVETPTVPSGLPTSDSTAYVPKYLPSTQPKVSAVASADGSSSGLTKAQIGGLIGGLVVLLLVILGTSYVIVRRLQKTAKIVGSRGGSSSVASSGKSSGNPNTGSGSGARMSKQMAQVHQPTPSQVNQLEYDELLEGTSRGVSTRGHTPPASTSSSLHNISNAMPNGSSRNIRAASMSSSVHPQAKVSSDMSTIGGLRDGDAGESFDIPGRPQNRPGRRSVSTDARTSLDSESRRGSTAWIHFNRMRQGSNASELSDTSNARMGTERLPAELGIDGGFIPELPSASSGPSVASSQMPGEQGDTDRKGKGRSYSGSSMSSAHLQHQPTDPFHSRNRSNSSNSVISFTPSHNRDRSGSSASYQQGQPQQQRLDSVSEAAEHLHGHYGPSNVAAGQTRAGVNITDQSCLDGH